MKTRIEWQRIRPIACEQICWPVKIRVRAKPPLLAPRLPPVFPASPLLGYRILRKRRVPSRWYSRPRAEPPDTYDWRILGEQDVQTAE